jgi:hypothetical protein
MAGGTDRGGGEADPVRSADGDILSESLAREELESPMHRELLGMPGRDLTADDHLPPDLLDHEVADPSVGELANLRLDLLSQGRAGVRTIKSHGVSLGEMLNQAPN